MKLAELQKKILQRIKDSKLETQSLNLLNKEPIPFEQRLGIYQNAYYLRIGQSLIDDFPKVKEKVGERKFNTLVKEYLQKCPSTFSSIAEISLGFPTFLHSLEWEKSQEFIPELARFELEKILVQLKKDESQDLPLNLSEKSIIHLNSTIVFFESLWSIHEDKDIQRQDKPYRILIYKSSGLVKGLEVKSQEEWKLLKLFDQRLSVENIFTLWPEITNHPIQEWMAYWTKENIIIKIS